jgi:CelD/BcsL family acetyltransferase involved in cellulose biosynthesis
MTDLGLRVEVMRPSALGAGEITLWHQMLQASPFLQRAFFSPAFALACDQVNKHAYVAVLHSGPTICGFLPFQFKSAWHQRVGLAERIGGDMSDNAGLIAWPDFSITAPRLLRLSKLASLSLSHIMIGQDRFGLTAEWSQLSYVADLSAGPDTYFAKLLARDRDLVRDTGRCQRKAERAYGPLVLHCGESISAETLAGVIAMKRLQYQRTHAVDPLETPRNLRLIEALNNTPTLECRLVLATLEAGGRALAHHLGLQYHGVLSWWFPAYDQIVRNVSPGRLLLWHMIRHAKENGVGLIDYGAGAAKYKQQFSTSTLQLGRAMWSAGNARSLLARAHQSLEWRLRRRLACAHPP